MLEPWVIYLMIGIGVGAACVEGHIVNDKNVGELFWAIFLAAVFWPMVVAYLCCLTIIRLGQKETGKQPETKKAKA